MLVFLPTDDGELFVARQTGNSPRRKANGSRRGCLIQHDQSNTVGEYRVIVVRMYRYAMDGDPIRCSSDGLAIDVENVILGV